jgi:hypothetical protein
MAPRGKLKETGKSRKQPWRQVQGVTKLAPKGTGEGHCINGQWDSVSPGAYVWLQYEREAAWGRDTSDVAHRGSRFKQRGKQKLT